jgi:hypothetical protein
MVILEVLLILIAVVVEVVEVLLDLILGVGVEMVNTMLKLMTLLVEVVVVEVLLVMIDVLGILNLTEVLQIDLKELEQVEVAKLPQDQEVLEKVVVDVAAGVEVFQEKKEVAEWLKLYILEVLEHPMVIIGEAIHFIFIMATHQCILIVNYGTLRRIR